MNTNQYVRVRNAYRLAKIIHLILCKNISFVFMSEKYKTTENSTTGNKEW